jgi:hypothetical protein
MARLYGRAAPNWPTTGRFHCLRVFSRFVPSGSVLPTPQHFFAVHFCASPSVQRERPISRRKQELPLPRNTQAVISWRRHFLKCLDHGFLPCVLKVSLKSACFIAGSPGFDVSRPAIGSGLAVTQSALPATARSLGQLRSVTVALPVGH